jgi:hypothetical protein
MLCATLSMLAAVRLDHETVLEADEVDDVRANWLLAAELVPIEAVRAEHVPQATFSIS